MKHAVVIPYGGENHQRLYNMLELLDMNQADDLDAVLIVCNGGYDFDVDRFDLPIELLRVHRKGEFPQKVLFSVLEGLRWYYNYYSDGYVLRLDIDSAVRSPCYDGAIETYLTKRDYCGIIGDIKNQTDPWREENLGVLRFYEHSRHIQDIARKAVSSPYNYRIGQRPGGTGVITYDLIESFSENSIFDHSYEWMELNLDDPHLLGFMCAGCWYKQIHSDVFFVTVHQLPREPENINSFIIHTTKSSPNKTEQEIWDFFKKEARE